MRNHANEVIRYKYPIVLWSVLVTNFTKLLPLRVGTNPPAATVGRCAYVVIERPPSMFQDNSDIRPALQL